MSIDELARAYENGYHRLLRVAEAILGDRELARDAVQDAFATLVRKRAAFRSTGSLEGWVWRTVVNTALNNRRGARPLVTFDESTSSEASTNGDRPDPEVRSVLAALPERQRLVLFLRYYADLDYRSIAEALGVKPGTVAATLNHGQAAVRRMLKEVPR